MFGVETDEVLLNAAAEETETPCSCSERSLTPPRAKCLRELENLCAHMCRLQSQMCVCVTLTDGQESLTGLFAHSDFWSLDQRAHHFTATAV